MFSNPVADKRIYVVGQFIKAFCAAPNGKIVEVPEAVHPWFIGVQFHPEFKSTPWDGHPLFNAFIKAAVEHKKESAKA